jgi:hypothetical protein
MLGQRRPSDKRCVAASALSRRILSSCEGCSGGLDRTAQTSHSARPRGCGARQFVTTQRIRKNEQLCHWYGPEWWSARNLKRANVGTSKYPAPLRESKQPLAANAGPARSGLKDIKRTVKGAIGKIGKHRSGVLAKQKNKRALQADDK